MKATGKYSPMELLIMLSEVYSPPSWNPRVTVSIKTTEHYFPVALYIIQHKAVLLFELFPSV